MPNHNYQRGRAFEWKVKKWYESQGWLVIRAAGSKGPADLVIIKPENPRVVAACCGQLSDPMVSLVQCKLGKVSRRERKGLAETARKFGVLATLATPATWRVERGCRPFATEELTCQP